MFEQIFILQILDIFGLY